MTATYVVSVGVADVRRDPDPTSELVTQALMNTSATANETSGEWVHVTLPDYKGWVRENELTEPIARVPCKVGEEDSTLRELAAVVTITHTYLYADAESDETLGQVYLSTAFPLLDITQEERVQVAIPGERSAWLMRYAIDIRRPEELYPRAPIRAVTNYARAFLDVPYLWGGTTWKGLDCSGFVQLCYRTSGYILPRDGDQQHDFLHHSVDRQEMQEGDLIFFGSEKITHVAMALNNREYIHSEGQNYNHVVINSFDPAAENYYSRLDEIFWGIKRVVV